MFICKHCQDECHGEKECSECNIKLSKVKQCIECHAELAHGEIKNQNIHIVGNAHPFSIDNDSDAFKKSND